MSDEAKEQLAALDLGSNSFHLVVARREQHALTVIDREREMVRLSAGLDEQESQRTRAGLSGTFWRTPACAQT